VATNEAKIVVSVDDKASKGIDGINEKAKAMRGTFLAVAGTVTAVGIASVKFASDLEEAANKASVTFGNAASQVETFAKTSADSFGLSQRAALESAASFGVILKATGQTEQASADMSVGLLKLSADMKSFNNIPMDQALEKLRAGLVGEAEPLRQVGILLSDATMKAKAAELGLGSLNGQLTEGEKVQARYAIIMEQAGVQHGDFARTADSLANQLTRTQAKMEDAAATLGAQLLPIATMVVEKISALVGWFASLDKTSQTIILVIGGVAGAIATLGLALPPLITGFVALKGAVLALNTAFAANPFGLIAAGISLIAVTLLPLIISNWDKLVETVQTGVNFMIGAAQSWLDTYIGIINKIIEGINKLGSVFGVEIDTIANVEIPRWQKAIKETEDVVEESGEAIIEENDRVAQSYGAVAESAEDAAERILKAQSQKVADYLESSKLEEELFDRERERNKNIWESHLESAQAIVDASNDRYAKIAEGRERDLAHDLEFLQKRSDAVEALKAANLEAFAAIRSEVEALPSVIPAAGAIGDPEAQAGRARVFNLFKQSQQRVEDQLAAAQARLASGEVGGGTTRAMLQGEVDRLLGITQSEQFRGERLGQLFAPPGGYGTGAPPTLAGQVYGEGVPGVTVVVEGSVVAEDLPSIVEKGLQELADQGAGYVGGAKFEEETLWH